MKADTMVAEMAIVLVAWMAYLEAESLVVL